MTVELTYLLYSVILTFVLIMIPASKLILERGLAVQAGSRDNVGEASVFTKRSQRLAANMLENMALFVPIVLVAHAAGVSNETTVLGTQIFLTARIAHAGIYLAGIPWLRPVAWFVAVVGIAMVLLQIL